MPRISEARKAEVRNQLIDAAITVLLAEGPAAATSRRVLEQAGLSAGALYHYFSSLDELYTAVAERFTELDEPLFEPTEDEAADPAAALAGIHVKVMSDLFGTGAPTIFGQLRIASMSNDGIKAAMSHYDELMVERAGPLNKASQQAGLFRDDLDPEALVEVISTFFEGFSTKAGTTGFATSRHRVLQLFLEMLGERVIEPDNPASAALRARIEELSTP